MGDFWKWAGVALLCGLVAVLLLPIWGRMSPGSPLTRDLSNAKNLGLAAKLYAVDHEGRFPMHLSELIPDYLNASNWDGLQFDARNDIHDHVLSKQDWLYFGSFFDEKNPPPILIASPQTPTGTKTKKRIIIRGDGTGSLVKDDEYQQQLRKTIEAMHKRGSVPDSKPEAQREAAKTIER